MNPDRIKGNWKQVKGEIKKRWGRLTDDELDEIGGERERLEGKLQEHYGWAREEVGHRVDEFFADFDRGRAEVDEDLDDLDEPRGI